MGHAVSTLDLTSSAVNQEAGHTQKCYHTIGPHIADMKNEVGYKSIDYEHRLGQFWFTAEKSVCYREVIEVSKEEFIPSNVI
jgi:hypothetical protein